MFASRLRHETRGGILALPMLHACASRLPPGVPPSTHFRDNGYINDDYCAPSLENVELSRLYTMVLFTWLRCDP